ncbi:Hypothetical protein PHPALM_20050 [Phytophthora palmivora]|uniref:Uncharacterized protein n=1 Tax=Phytophthora palmivora TaxID=4796 RepID=A0A2P4XFU4_9STRA|nr:Hypothetical protein PHPALM_20050 [Phytophthora palmivora]
MSMTKFATEECGLIFETARRNIVLRAMHCSAYDILKAFFSAGVTADDIAVMRLRIPDVTTKSNQLAQDVETTEKELLATTMK